MTFEQLDRKLPNGFHDSEIREIRIDFAARFILIGVNLLVGLPDTPNSEEYRLGTLRVGRPYLFFLEPPDAGYPFTPIDKPVNASATSVQLGKNPKLDGLLRRIPPDATAFVFFLDDWNSYLYVAGGTLEFSWDDGGIFDPTDESTPKAGGAS